jgi:FeS assembly SUF system protein
MSNEKDYKAPEPILSLPVVSNHDKVEQLKQEFRDDPPKKLNETSLIDRAVDPSKTAKQKEIEEKVIEALKLVYDPEIPVNIYELGLIYSIDVDPDTSAVSVKMTLTAPGCPVAGSLPREVQQRIESVPGVPQAVVELVWDPPWTKDRMSEAAQLELGLI